MATLGRLSVQLGADVAPLQRGFKNAEGAIQNFKNSTGKAQAGLSNLSKTTGNSTMAVVNFNRVIQDAPFGILGVANNLEPLITSFNGLRASTGSVTGAIGTLLKSAFTGPGALITVVSLASTAMIFFTQRMRGAGSASKQEAESVKKFNEALKELRDIATQSDISIVSQAEAEIKVLRRNIGVLEDLEAKEGELIRAKNLLKNSYNDAFDRQQIVVNQLQEEFDQLAKLQRGYGLTDTKLKDLKEELEDQIGFRDALIETMDEEARVGLKLQKMQEGTTQAINRFKAGLEGSEEGLREQATQVQRQIELFRQLAGQTDTDLSPAIVALQDQLQTLKDTFSAMQGEELPDISADIDVDEEQVQEELNSISSKVKIDVPINITINASMIEGSIGQLEARMRSLKNAQDLVTNPQAFQALQQQIDAMQQIVDAIRGSFEEVPEEVQETDESVKSLALNTKAVAGFADMVGGAFAQAVIQGRRLDDALKGILAQLASRAFVVGLGSILTGGASLGGASFLGNVFGGVFHTGGIVPGRGEKLALVQGGEGVFTQDQMKALGSMNSTSSYIQPMPVNIQVDGRTILKTLIDIENRANR